MPTVDIAQRFRDAIPINRVPDFVPGRPHSATAMRWAKKGVRGVKLESVLIGGRRMVTLTALEEFLQALNSRSDAVNSRSEPSEVDAPADSARRGREACNALADMGY